MVQAADLLSAIHNSLHHGIQAQNDTTKGGNCLFAPTLYVHSFPSGVYNVWFVFSKILFNSVCVDLGMFCFIGVYRAFMWSLKFFSRIKHYCRTWPSPVSYFLGSEYLLPLVRMLWCQQYVLFHHISPLLLWDIITSIAQSSLTLPGGPKESTLWPGCTHTHLCYIILQLFISLSFHEMLILLGQGLSYLFISVVLGTLLTLSKFCLWIMP